MAGVMVAVGLGFAGYVAAERNGRPPGVWLVVVLCAVLLAYGVGAWVYAAAAHTNAIYAEGASLIVIVPTMMSLLTGVALVAWIGLGPRRGASFGRPVSMIGGFDDALAPVEVHVADGILVVRRGADIERFRPRERDGVARDGEYVVVTVVGASSPLMLRAHGDGAETREARTATAKALVRSLGSPGV